MLNGAVTIGTMDGANVEISELVGEDNIYIFGESSENVIQHYLNRDYDPRDYYCKDDDIKTYVDFIVSEPMKNIGDKESLERIYKELTTKDWFMTLLDVKNYIATKEKAFKDYVLDTLKEFPAKKEFVSITYTTASQELLNQAKEICEEQGFKNVIFTQAGATVSCHCGENCIGIMYECLK